MPESLCESRKRFVAKVVTTGRLFLCSKGRLFSEDSASIFFLKGRSDKEDSFCEHYPVSLSLVSQSWNCMNVLDGSRKACHMP